MKLSLHLHNTPQHAPAAALVRGAGPGDWLREIGRWQVPAAALHCYVLPASLQSRAAVGLFVVVDGPAPLPADVREPYGVVADRLYVPLHAGLRPTASPDELAASLLWECQVFHPTIGLVGFDKTDCIDLADLLDCGPPAPADWTRALPGPPPAARLHSIRLLPPTTAEVLDSLRAGIGTAPLADIPGQPAPRTPLQQALDKLGQGALEAGLAATSGLGKLLAGAAGALGALGSLGNSVSGGNGQVGGTGATGPGLLEKLQKWFAGNLEELEQQRRNEIQRLLDLFGQDMAEALKYALPLDSPYLNRGTAPPSSWLGPRATDFDLRGLGGGGRVDSWNLDAQTRLALTTRYREAAEQEVAAGRPKKAAYIYAHLLGDYRAAAKTLRKGGCFREAAALYRDHLHDTLTAAECLAEGGLLLEAIELYSSINQHEKAGDLYTQLGQPALAVPHYERAVAAAHNADNYLGAAALLVDKLARPTQAQQELLLGWDKGHRAEDCLRSYFDLSAAAQPEGLPTQLREFYQAHTLPAQVPDFLRVLVAVKEKYPSAELDLATRRLGYEIVSAETEAGNKIRLATLKKLLPTDRLIGPDCSRYVSR
jgi:tetratricopeptide (TPR) repeat protein